MATSRADVLASCCRRIVMYSGFIPTVPQPKQSVRFGQGRGYADPKKAAYQKALRDAIPDVPAKLSGNVHLLAVFIYKGPLGFKVGRADRDNLLKPLQDAMKGKLFNDDNQIVAGEEYKLASPTHQPGIYWEVSHISIFYPGKFLDAL